MLLLRTLGPSFLFFSALILISALAGAQSGVNPSFDVVQVTDSSAGAYEPSLTVLGDGFAGAWYDTRDGQAEIYLRLLDSAGTPEGPERRVTNNSEASYEVDIAAVGDSMAVVWYDRTNLATYEAKLSLLDPEGARIWTRTLSSPGLNGRIPVLLVRDTEMFSAWVEDDRGENHEVWAVWYDLEGRPLTEPWRLGAASRRTWNLNAKLDLQGAPWVTFDATVETGADELFLVEARGGNVPVRLTSDDGFDSKYPDLAFGEDTVAVTWWDLRNGNEEVYLSVSSIESIQEEVESRALRITTTPGESIGAVIAWNAPRFGLAWNDDTPGQDEVYFQSFNSQGRSAGPLQKLTGNETHSLIPAIRPWEDGFALIWNEVVPGKDGVAVHQGVAGRSQLVFALVR